MPFACCLRSLAGFDPGRHSRPACFRLVLRPFTEGNGAYEDWSVFCATRSDKCIGHPTIVESFYEDCYFRDNNRYRPVQHASNSLTALNT
jgi:hypothetical protein